MPDTTKYVDASEPLRNIAEIARMFPLVAEKLLAQIAHKILAWAKEHAPFKTGDLRGSGKVIPVPGGGFVIAFTAPHAAAQHEHTEYHHNVGEAKYLEHALFTIGLGPMPQELAQKLLDELNRGINHAA